MPSHQILMKNRILHENEQNSLNKIQYSSL